MGAADVVPGVSGGTIAFITGIYEKLVAAIDGLDKNLFHTLFKEGIKKSFQKYQLDFLSVLFMGILVSILSFARLITYLLEYKPLYVWGFFFGLILASIVYLMKDIKQWRLSYLLFFLLAAAAAYSITILTPAQSDGVWWYLLLSGMIAIIAMILPGISGAFILLLLGSYEYVITAVKGITDAAIAADVQNFMKHFKTIAIFAVGAIIGLKLFSKILNWLFKNYKEVTLVILIGFMTGSLNKIWPWKNTLSTRINSHGNEIPFIQESVLPTNFEGQPELAWVFLFIALGITILFAMEWLAKRLS
ncbi:MAG: DUF368 domain-containing protein [Flavobacteriaceae bacterium]|nr:DUF368 domain-containing protein [Flavobacteriaceae bacterium]